MKETFDIVVANLQRASSVTTTQELLVRNLDIAVSDLEYAKAALWRNVEDEATDRVWQAIEQFRDGIRDLQVDWQEQVGDCYSISLMKDCHRASRCRQDSASNRQFWLIPSTRRNFPPNARTISNIFCRSYGSQMTR